MDTVYGVQVTSHTDPRLVIAEKVNKMTMEAVLPGAFLVDAFPMRKFQSFYWSEFAIILTGSRSKIFARVVPWSYLPQVCKGVSPALPKHGRGASERDRGGHGIFKLGCRRLQTYI